MSDPFIGEIRLWAIPFAPRGWALCNGQSLPVQQNTALFSLLRTLYGGNGTSTFCLPDFRGRTLMHRSTTNPAFQQGANWAGGTETVAFSGAGTLPLHTHALVANNSAGTSNNPSSQWLAGTAASTTPGYMASKPTTVLNPAAVSTTGTSTPQTNTQPSTVINFCIALQGLYPTRD